MKTYKQHNQTERKELFARAKQEFDIFDIWQALKLPGSPAGSCSSPFREDNSPSFSIFGGGQSWKDHGTDEGGDLIAFMKRALGSNEAAGDWLLGVIRDVSFEEVKKRIAYQKPKSIQWPAPFDEGSRDDWDRFSENYERRLVSVCAAVEWGILKFGNAYGHRCVAFMDNENRAAEIRRLDRGLFGDSKQFPLAGVDKSWLVGADRLRNAPLECPVLLTEGATDLMAAIDLHIEFLRRCGIHHLPPTAWYPVALLGAGCKSLHPACEDLIRGRHVRLVPDADGAGEVMKSFWQLKLYELGCKVDVVELESGADLCDAAKVIEPEVIFAWK